MDENISKKMKEIVLEEDKSGYVIDAVASTARAKKKGGEAKEADKEKDKAKVDDGSGTKKGGGKKAKKEKVVDSGDSGESDAAANGEGGKKLDTKDDPFRRTGVSFSTVSNSNTLLATATEADPETAESHESLTLRSLSKASGEIPLIESVLSNKHVSLVINKADLKTKLTDAGSNLVVIDFFATWCGPCKMISPKVEELAKECPDVMFLKVDIDECDDIATEYEVQSMPTFVFIKNGAKIDGFSGANYDKLKETVQKLK